MNYTKGEWTIGMGGRISCEDNILIATTSNTSFDKREQHANGLLIAAAPDLLEALKELMSYRTDAPYEVTVKAERAINKAEGVLVNESEIIKDKLRDLINYIDARGNT